MILIPDHHTGLDFLRFSDKFVDLALTVKQDLFEVEGLVQPVLKLLLLTNGAMVFGEFLLLLRRIKVELHEEVDADGGVAGFDLVQGEVIYKEAIKLLVGEEVAQNLPAVASLVIDCLLKVAGVVGVIRFWLYEFILQRE